MDMYSEELDPIEQDERKAVVEAIDHAFREDLSQSPTAPAGTADLVYEDYLHAADNAWLNQGETPKGKPWEHRTPKKQKQPQHRIGSDKHER